VGPGGVVYVGSADGSLHALSADGAFRWSISLNGAVLGAPVVGPRGIYAATANGQISALREDGVLAWSLRPLAPPATGVVLGPGGELYFAGRDGALYSVSHQGGALSRTVFRQGISVGPVSAGRELMIGTNAGELVFFGSEKRPRHFNFGRRLEVPAALGSDAAYVISGGELVSVDLSGQRRWSAAGFRSVVLGSQSVVACGSGGQLTWFSFEGRAEQQARLTVTPSGALRVAESGAVLVPSEEGTVVVLSPSGRVEREARIARAPVVGIELDTPRARALVAAGDGSVVALGLAPPGGAP
jgi:hypothetical protein